MVSKPLVLITGASGFFGSRFVSYFKDELEIRPFSRKELDVTDEAKVREKILKIKPDFVVHTAAIAQTNKCDEDPQGAFNINVNGSINIAKACKESSSKLIFLSTEQLFNGNKEPGPYNEDAEPMPNTVYGKNKLEAEKEVTKILDNNVWIVRLSWLFGLPERDGNITENIVWSTIRDCLHRKSMNVPYFEYRGMTYVYHLLAAFRYFFQENPPPSGVYHLSSENKHTRYDVVVQLLQLLGLKQDEINQFVKKDEKKYADCPRDIRIDSSKFERVTGYHFPSTMDAIAECLKEFHYI